MPDNHRNSGSLLIMQYSSNMVTNCIYKSMYGPVQCHFPSQFLSMQLNCNPSFDQVHVSDQFRKLVKFFSCANGLTERFSFSQNRTPVFQQINIFAPCTVLFVSNSSVFTSLSGGAMQVHLTPVLFSENGCILLQSCLWLTVSN